MAIPCSIWQQRPSPLVRTTRVHQSHYLLYIQYLLISEHWNSPEHLLLSNQMEPDTVQHNNNIYVLGMAIIAFVITSFCKCYRTFIHWTNIYTTLINQHLFICSRPFLNMARALVLYVLCILYIVFYFQVLQLNDANPLKSIYYCYNVSINALCIQSII